MRTKYVATMLILVAAAANVAGCTSDSRGQSEASTYSSDNSTLPSRKCNPSVVVNPNFLGRNEGIAGAGQPELPGQGSPSDCPQ